MKTEWKSFSVYIDKVTFEYHNDTGSDHNIVIDAEKGVQLLGQNILPSAQLVGAKWEASNPR